MSNLFWLTDAQMARLQPFFPKSHGRPRVDDRRVLSGIIFINRNGLRWCDAPKEYGPPKTLYNPWKRWSDKGVFARMMDGLTAEAAVPKTAMIDATYLKAHPLPGSTCRACARGARRPACGRKRGARRAEGPSDRPNQGRHEPLPGRALRSNGPRGTKLHAVTDADGRPIRFFMTAGPPLGDARIACRATGQRLHRCRGPAGQPAKGGLVAGRPGL